MKRQPLSTLPAWGLFLAALALLVAAAVLQYAVTAALRRLWPDLEITLLAGLANLVALPAVTISALWFTREIPGFGRGRFNARFGAGLVLVTLGGSVLLGELANVAAFFAPLSPEFTRLFNELLGASLGPSLFTLVFVAAVTEETLFRGVLLPAFERQWGRWPALVLSSALFGLFHLNPWQAPAAFAAGLFLGWVFLRTGSLIYPMAVHGLFNGLPLLLGVAGLEVRGYNTPLSGAVEFQPPLWDALGAVLLALGLWVCRRWAPLSPPPVSDKVAE